MNERREFFKQECDEWWNELSPTEKDEWILKHYIQEHENGLEEKWEEKG